MVRIKDIAEKANVSTATVSYVLNGTGNVGEETKKKVLKVIEELNYKPNSIAKSLKLNKTNTIGVIVEDITVFNAPEIIDGINEYADKNGWSIILTNMRLYKRVGPNFNGIQGIEKNISQAVEELLSKRVDGIIYIGIHTRDLSGILPEINKPIIFTYCYSGNNISVNYNDEAVAYDATKYLIAKGHKKISVISGFIDSDPTRGRFDGYYKALTESKLLFDPQYVKTGDWEFDSGYKYAKELLLSNNPPTAILAMNDLMAAGVLKACRDVMLKVPEEVSVMGIDDREASNYLTPRLTTMKLPLNEMGSLSICILTKLINEEVVEQPKLLNCQLIERESVASI